MFYTLYNIQVGIVNARVVLCRKCVALWPHYSSAVYHSVIIHFSNPYVLCVLQHSSIALWVCYCYNPSGLVTLAEWSKPIARLCRWLYALHFVKLR